MNEGELTLDWNLPFDNYYCVTNSRVQFALDGLTSHDCISLFILVHLHPSQHHGTVHHHYHYPVCLLSVPSDRQSLCVKVHLRNNKNLFAVFTSILRNKWPPMYFWSLLKSTRTKIKLTIFLFAEHTHPFRWRWKRCYFLTRCRHGTCLCVFFRRKSNWFWSLRA